MHNRAQAVCPNFYLPDAPPTIVQPDFEQVGIISGLHVLTSKAAEVVYHKTVVRAVQRQKWSRRQKRHDHYSHG